MSLDAPPLRRVSPSTPASDTLRSTDIESLQSRWSHALRSLASRTFILLLSPQVPVSGAILMAEIEDRSLDLVGVGKLAQAIPDTAWEKLVETACQTFTQIFSPITATTGGLGRLIQAKFDRLIEPQKVLAAEVVSRANEKAKSRSGKGVPPKAPIVLAVLEASSIETDETLRDLWANLLAREMLSGMVHPEFTRTLSRLSSYDAQVLAEIATRPKPTVNDARASIFKKSLVRIGVLSLIEGTGFSQELLASLNLIHKPEGLWDLTATGRAFIEAVSDPSISK